MEPNSHRPIVPSSRRAGSTGRHRRTMAVMAALLAVVAAACVAPPAPPHQLDVDNPPHGVIGGLVTSNAWQHVQTFTAGRTGCLDQVNLWIQFLGPGDLLVSVHQVVGTNQVGAVIGSATYHGAATGEVAVPLTVQGSVVKGQRYAIVLRQTVSESSGSWQLSFSSTGPMPGETYYVEYDNPHRYVFPDPGYNLSFRTFVRPA
jgi:hypothetical protein